MSSRLSTISAAAVAIVALVSPAAAEKEVRVYNWSDYIDESILEDFTKETGIKVVYDVFDSNEVLETKLLAGKTGYDIVVPTGSFLSRQIKAGVFQKLDKAKIPNIKNLWPEVSDRVAIYDPGNEYAITYMWGTTGVGYNEGKIKERMPDAPVKSLKMIFDPAVAEKFKDCGIYVLDSPEDIVPPVLNFLGLDPNTTKPEDFKKAEELLMKIRPFIKKFHSSEYIDAMANGDACMALGWSGDLLQARTRAEEAKNGHVISYNIPEEGTQMWFDMMAIPKDAPHVEEALIFLNYLHRPEVIAKASNYVAYANGNLASQEFLDEAVKSNPAVYPDAATMKKLYVKTAWDDKTQRLVTRMWTRIKTGQ
ncbi:MAG: polyamine ABC transporter substrate-binding protein [Hyphomicrobium sp.]|nr:polyamine ABC transporter substrate-binding protein [Hyphomicrobium sp.]